MNQQKMIALLLNQQMALASNYTSGQKVGAIQNTSSAT